MATLVSELPHPGEQMTAGGTLSDAHSAQSLWAAVPLQDRLAVVRRTRHFIADTCHELAAKVPGPNRNLDDTLVAEVLPLAEACRFLERQAASILRPTKLGSKGRPFWLRGVAAEAHRVPLGVVLIIAPANYPLFLPGVQCMQALVAGNAVLWKPAAGGSAAAHGLARLLALAGLPHGVLQILDESPQAGIDAIQQGVDKVFLTGHADTGRSVLHELAETGTPSVMELSGCDAVFVLPGADLERVASALAFGLRLNGGATCMAPRRVYATQALIQALLPILLAKLEDVPRVALSSRVRASLDSLLLDARRRGAALALDGRSPATDADDLVGPSIVINTPPDATILRTDIFAPLLAFCPVVDEEEALAANSLCPYALTAAIFGPERAAQSLSTKLCAGTVLINDLIVSTADPRVPFGGRRGSGFGVTRGREGLLAMTAVKTVLTQKNRSLRPYTATTEKHGPFFTAYIQAVHSGSVSARLRALRRLFSAARSVEK